jgi:hypothetical protein
MGAVITVIALSALIGTSFSLPRTVSWLGIGVGGFGLAVLSAAVLQCCICKALGLL